MWITTRIKPVMLLSGLLTSTMLYAAIAPQAALQSTFGETLTGPVAEIVVRNWGALIGLVGMMLIYGAYDPPSRRLALIVAALSKTVFVTLVFVSGGRYLEQAGVPVVVDTVFVCLFVWYLAVSPRQGLSGRPNPESRTPSYTG
jgi:hypothetical protein